MLELITAISKVTVAETRCFLFTSEDDTHDAAVVTMLQDSRGDKNCSLTLTLTLLGVTRPAAADHRRRPCTHAFTHQIATR